MTLRYLPAGEFEISCDVEFHEGTACEAVLLVEAPSSVIALDRATDEGWVRNAPRENFHSDVCNLCAAEGR